MVFLFIVSWLPILILFGLLCLLLSKIWNRKNVTKETAEATSVMISAEITKAEQPTESSRQGVTCQNVKEQRKSRTKA
jgi:hypothetical protein